MFIGDRKTKYSIRACRASGEVVSIHKGAILHDVRTVAQKNPRLHIFEYRGETLYIRLAERLMEATEAAKAIV